MYSKLQLFESKPIQHQIIMPKLRIATLQLNSNFLSPNLTIQKTNTLLQKLQASPNYKPLDLLVLPEMIMTGYNFKDRDHVAPMLESPYDDADIEGSTVLKWGRDTALKFGCVTVLGYVEGSKPNKAGDDDGSSPIYNSAIVFNKNGSIIHNYHKSFLYETDEKFGCSEGAGFNTFTIPFESKSQPGVITNIKASIGICMDLNPYQFKAPFNKFEFSSFCYREGVRLIITPMAWLHNKSPSIIENLSRLEEQRLTRIYTEQFNTVAGVLNVDDCPEQSKNMGILNKYTSDKLNGQISTIDEQEQKQFKQLQAPDFTNLDYWILRFLPFVNYPGKPFQSFNKTTLVISNRVGLEDDVLFGGTSSIVQFNGSQSEVELDGLNGLGVENGSVDVLGVLGKGDDAVLVRDVGV